MEKIIKKAKDFEDLLGSHKYKILSNGFVYNVFLKQNRNATETAKYLIQQFSKSECKVSSLTLLILRVNEKIQFFKRHIHYSWDRIVVFLSEDFKFPLARASLLPVQPKTPPSVSLLKTRINRECHSCEKRKLYNKALLTQNKKLRTVIKTVKKEKTTISKTFQVKRVNQLIKRTSRRISKYQLKAQKYEADVISLTKSLKKLNLKCKSLVKENKSCKKKILTLEFTILDLEKKLRVQDLALKESDITIDQLNCDINQIEKGSIFTKEKKSFNASLRLVVYHCLESNVPVDAIPKVIMSCSSLGNVNLKPQDLPNLSTIAQMSREMGVIALLQVAETIINADVVTLAFDATTIKGIHINQIHFATKQQILTASITELPGGKAEDYVKHITDTIEDLANTYAAYYKLEIADVRKKLMGKIMSTLTDRASVNHAAVVKLNSILEKELLELNCHLHPLDGIASETRKALQKLNDTIPSTTYGSDCRAANLLYSISKLRYKAKGDPHGFKSFLKQSGLSCSTFPRYVGNRLHILFCSAGIVYRHRQILVNYLEKYCNNTTLLRTSLLRDFKNEEIMIHLQALGLWGKFLTGPWMALFYAEEKQRNYFELAEYLKSAIKVVEILCNEPEFLLSSQLDAFGRPLISDETLVTLRIIEGKYLEQLLSVLKIIANATVTVLKRQLSRYLTGELSTPSQFMQDKAVSAPINNIWAEKTLGMIDFFTRRAPNAEISFLDGKTKVKVNKSLDWLCNNTKKEQEKIVKFCISRGAVSRKQSKERRLRGEELAKLRLKEKGQKREMEQRNRLARDIKKLILENSLEIVHNSIFSSLSEYQRVKVLEMLNENPVKIEGARVEHLWNEEGNEVAYKGRIVMKLPPVTGKVVSFIIAYWKEDEEEDDAEDFKIPVDSLLADVALGDLVFY
ncbi:uncharacterized protein LOC136084869 [Hydra vulgaris]|uniref:Uncharacterized protein LOC136084869 n=1 Tax=Hydra vulgaris TaxID=6087 RepID=A0ABM4CK50_HYDVU